MKSPFINDSFSMVFQAFKELYPDVQCECCIMNEVKDEEGNAMCGCTTFDNGKAYIEISAQYPLYACVETLAHELAHAATPDDQEHGEVWDKAFNSIHDKFDEIGQSLFN